MFCLKCGNKIEDGESFCTKCGEKVEVIQESLDTQPKKKNKKALVGISIGAAAVIVAVVVVIAIFTGIHNSSMNRPFDQLKKGINTKNVELCLDASFPKDVRKRMEKEFKKKDIDITDRYDYNSKTGDDPALQKYCYQKYYATKFIDAGVSLDVCEMDKLDYNDKYNDSVKESLKERFNIDASDVIYCSVKMTAYINGENEEDDADAYLYKYKGKWYALWDF